MGRPFFLVDAFIDHPFSGNPAGVCILEREMPSLWMQQVANEINQAETAFLWLDAKSGWQLRWFTPIAEVRLCGHATLASAHALWTHCGESSGLIEFHTHSGLLTANRVGDGIQLDFPADQPIQMESINDDLIELFGHLPQWCGRGRDDVLVVLDSAQQVREFKPDFNLIKSITQRGLIITAPGNQLPVATDGQPIDMVSRFFAPSVGIDEDPVTGSAHCLLAVYWGQRLRKCRLTALQASKRTGLLTLDWNGDRVLLTGKARTMVEGVFHG